MITTAARLEFNLPRGQQIFDIRSKLVDLYKKARVVDKTFKMGTFGKEQVWARPQDVPKSSELGETIRDNVITNRNGQTTLFYVTTYSVVPLKEIERDRRVNAYLREHRAWLKEDIFMARHVMIV